MRWGTWVPGDTMPAQIPVYRCKFQCNCRTGVLPSSHERARAPAAAFVRTSGRRAAPDPQPARCPQRAVLCADAEPAGWTGTRRRRSRRACDRNRRQRAGFFLPGADLRDWPLARADRDHGKEAFATLLHPMLPADAGDSTPIPAP